METLKIKFEVGPFQARDWMVQEHKPHMQDVFHWMQTMSDTCAQAFKQAKVDVGFFVTSSLYSVWTGTVYNNDEWIDIGEEELDDAVDSLWEHEENYAIFRAQPSLTDRSFSFYGLELELDSSGQATSDQVVELIRERLLVSVTSSQQESIFG